MSTLADPADTTTDATEGHTVNPATDTVVVATGNLHKLAEIEAILSKCLPGASFVPAHELAAYPDPEEDGDDFEANSRIKAEAALRETGAAWAVADDSGLMVDALDGAPGVMSARYAGEHGNDAANNEKLLHELANVLEPDRTARFVSVVCLLGADGSELVGRGTCEGAIGFAPRGSNGFGYDPLFLPEDTPGKTMAELAPEEKNAISHRFHALEDLAQQIASER